MAMEGVRRALLEAEAEVEREENRVRAQGEQHATERAAFAREKAILGRENTELKERIVRLEDQLHAAEESFAQQLKRRELQAERECRELRRQIERAASYAAAQRALPRVRGQPDPRSGDAAPRLELMETSRESPLLRGEARSPSGRRFSLYNTYARLLEREGLSPTTLFIA